MTAPVFLLKGGTIVTQNKAREVLSGDVLIEGARIKKIAKNIVPPEKAELIDCTNRFVIPGLIQTHTHLCQTLFRGLADDLSLIDWLQKRIWPLESTHTEKSLSASAEVGLLEMQLTGTTSILDMGTVRHTDALLETVSASGMRYIGGKCLMDLKKFSGPLYEETTAALFETEKLIARWNGNSELLEYALCPRFVVSCTDEILKACVTLQKKYKLFIHTHASESKDEIAIVRKRTGRNNIDFLDDLGFLNSKTVIVHGVHMTKTEVKKMVKTKTSLVHCPSSNLKLGSGFAPIETYKNAKMKIGIGSDGAPCNNTMDMFMEMRLAALIQKPLFGPTALPARAAFDMATLAGAEIIGKKNELGSLEVGKLADIVTVDRSHPSVATVDDPYSALVYSCSGRDVHDVFIHGRPVVRRGEHQIYSREKVLQNARAELALSVRRALN